MPWRLIAKLPHALVEQRREVRGLAEALPRLDARLNVIAERGAVGERAGVARLWPVDYSVAHNYGAIGIERSEGELVHEGETTPVSRIGDILARLDWSHVDFLKIDAQTYEFYVLQGAEATVRSRRPVVFVEVSPYWMRKTGYDYREIYKFLQSADYTILEPHQSLVDPVPVRPWSGDEGEEWDLLGVPRERLGLLSGRDNHVWLGE